MRIDTKYNVGDKVAQGEIHSFKFEAEYDGETTLEYWLVSGRRFYQESELTPIPIAGTVPCPNCRAQISIPMMKIEVS
jgi:hypothetical protein